MTKLIRHNQKKKAIEIFKKAKDIKVYTLDNSFLGTSVNVLEYKGENWLLYKWLTFDFSRLEEEKPGKFCLKIHSNCWYEFKN